MSDKVIKIGMLRIELHLAFDGVGAAIWEDDDLLRPTKRTLRLSLNGKEMKTLVDGVNSFYANKQPVGPTPHPVATLCEAVAGFLDRYDRFNVSDENEGVTRTAEYWIEQMRHALTAERKRAVLVKEAFREYKAGHVTNCACSACEALRALDAFDKGAENG